MKQLEKQYDVDVKKPANFSFDRRSYMAGGRAALLWFWKTAKHISPSDYEILEKEFEDEASQNSI